MFLFQPTRCHLPVTITDGIIITASALLTSILFEFIGKKDFQALSRALRRFQKTVSGLILFLSIIHCVILSRDIPLSNESDPVLIGALFEALYWLVLAMSMLERRKSAGISHCIAWSLSTICHGIGLVSKTTLQCKPTAFTDLDSSFLKLRLCMAMTLSLLSGAGMVRLLSIGISQEKVRYEYGGDHEESAAEMVGLKELQNRPLAQYVASLGIFLVYLKSSTVQQWRRVTAIYVCILTTRLTNLLVPISIGALVDNLASAVETGQFPWETTISYLGVLVLTVMVSTVSSLLTIRFQIDTQRPLSLACYTHTMNLSCNFHEDRNSQGIINAMENTSCIANLLRNILFSFVPSLSDLIIFLGVTAWLFGGYQFFIMITTITCFIYANATFIRPKREQRRIYVKSRTARWLHLWETSFNWMTVSHFNRIEHEQVEAANQMDIWCKQFLKQQNIDTCAQLVGDVILGIGFVATVYLAIRQIMHGHLSIGDLAIFIYYRSQVLKPLENLISIINKAKEELIDSERLLLLLEKTPTVQDNPDANNFEFLDGTVEFQNVSLSYDKRIVLSDISFRVEGGQTVAIVGETGSGKTSLLKLLYRFYDPFKGRILVDGQDLRHCKTESLRAFMGFVPQKPAMFTRSVADNVRYAYLAATDEQVETACKNAALHDNTKDFMKQRISEGGANLSGGEVQRIGIARVFLKRPKPQIILLDEATSSVDSKTELTIRESLEKFCKGRTTFIVAHRLSTIVHAHLILVIKDGKLVETGSHHDLVKQRGAYHELWMAQQATGTGYNKHKHE